MRYPNFHFLTSSTMGRPYPAPTTAVPLDAAPNPATYFRPPNPANDQPAPSAATTGSAPYGSPPSEPFVNDDGFMISKSCLLYRNCIIPIFYMPPEDEGQA